QVEDTLFCVPRFVLEQSSDIFRDMFGLPSGQNNNGEGASNKAPIILDGIKVWDFKQLLRALYAAKPDQSEPGTIDEWTAVYKLSQRWEMVALTKYAKERLGDLAEDPVEKAGLAQDLFIFDWKVAAFQEIVRRAEPLSMREVERLGIHTVENKLFRVPRVVLQESSDVFCDMFSLPSGPNNGGEGESSKDPIVLDGVTVWDFKQLLRALHAEDPNQSEPNTIEAWVAVYKLSQRWEMTALSNYAKEKLWNLAAEDPVERAGLAQDLNIPDWKIPSFQDIARRKEPLSMRDVERLGVQTVLKLAQVRECAFSSNSTRCWKRTGASQIDFTSMIQEAFGDDLKE
ncbi:hypothetical protein CONPUDRAFT_67386, partial [Coniophora puteana RWD-64-598 SS2]